MLLRSLNPLAVAQGDDIPDAIRIGDTTLSRGDVLGAATSVAERVARADRVAILATPTVTTVLAVVGCLIAGVTAVPVPPDSGSAELEHILRDSGAQAWLGEAPADAAGLPVVPVRVHARSWHSYPEPPESDIAFVLYTSGTTGPPKGVLISRKAIAAGLDALADAWQWTGNDTLVQGLPLFHVHGLILGVLGPLRIGSRLVHTVKPTPAAYAAARGTMYFGVPTVWSRIADDPESARALSGARLLVSGSAPLPVPVFEKLHELTGLAPIERYGMSETMLTLSTRADGERRPGWVGVPVRGVETRLRDERGGDVPTTANPSAVCRCGARCSSTAIWAGPTRRPNPSRTTASSRPATSPSSTRRGSTASSAANPRTSSSRADSGSGRGGGDLSSRPPECAGSRGGRPSRPGPRAAARSVRGGDDVSESELIEHVATELSVHKRPREIRVVESLPRNAMGKVQKKQLF